MPRVSFLEALSDTILPGGNSWPAASRTHLPAFLSQRAGEFAHIAEALERTRMLLPADFAGCDGESRTAALRGLEADDPPLVASVVDEVFRGYYTDPEVLSVLERKTGYPARPPQPLGRTVQPFDWSTLDRRSIGPSRPAAPEGTSA